MFTLIDHHGQTALMRNGKPFTYTTRELAHRGKLALETHATEVEKRTVIYQVREVR